MAVDWNQAEVTARIRQGALRGVLIGGQLVHDTAVRKILSPPKTGRTYRRRGVTHVASAPGQPPASDTGRLAGSGSVVLHADALTARVNFATIYARALEIGTERMAPRPYARPSLVENRSAIEDAVAEQIRATLGGGR